MWVVTPRETRNANPRIDAPHAVLKVGSPEMYPFATAYAPRIEATMENTMAPTMRREIQPMARPSLAAPAIRLAHRKSGGGTGPPPPGGAPGGRRPPPRAAPPR